MYNYNMFILPFRLTLAGMSQCIKYIFNLVKKTKLASDWGRKLKQRSLGTRMTFIEAMLLVGILKVWHNKCNK